MRILLAEDDRMSAEATRELLESQGWSTEWASDGRKAWTLYQRRKPDLVLLDLDMPKMDGLTLIQQMRETDKRTPIVLYSGKAGTAEEVKALEAGEDPTEALTELKMVLSKITAEYPEVNTGNIGVGSTIFAVKPGDGSAREQAASCQKVLGGWANIAND